MAVRDRFLSAMAAILTSWMASGFVAAVPVPTPDDPSASAGTEESGTEQIAEAISQLSDAKFSKRQAAYRMLVQQGVAAIPRLEQAASAKEWNVAERCVKALGEIAKEADGTEAALAALGRLADDPANRIAKLARMESEQLMMSDEERAIGALEAAGVRIRRNRDGAVYMISISRDQDLFWLKFLPDLRYVGLTQLKVTDQGIDHLADCDQVQSVSLYQTSVTDVGIAKLAKLDALATVSLSGENISADGIRSLRHVAKLRSFSWQSEISQQQLDALGELKQLTSLSLSSVQLSEQSIQVINGLNQLSRLSLVLNGVNDDQCATLAQIKIPSVLSVMQSPDLSANGWKSLSGMNLQSLMVYRSPISDGDLRWIAAITSLTTLAITDAAITDEGLAELKTLTNLRYLNLRDTKVTQEGADQLKKELPKLSSVSVSSRGGVGALAPAKPYSLYAVAGKKNAHMRVPLTPQIVEQLKAEADLDTVFMTRTQAKDEHIKLIATLPIKGLVLDSDEITDGGLEALKDHQQLQTLTVTSDQITDDCKDALLAIPSLTKLWLHKSQLSDSGTQALIQGLSQKAQITSLNLANCPAITNDAFSGIEKLNSLQQLVLSDNPGVDSGVFRSLSEMANLTEIRLAGTVVNADDLSHLGKLKIERIHFTGAQLGDGAMAALAQACPNVKQLGLASSNVDDSMMDSIGKFTQLEWLWLYKTSVGDDGLAKLDDLKQLKRVYVNGETVSQFAEQAFQQKHPQVVLQRN